MDTDTAPRDADELIAALGDAVDALRAVRSQVTTLPESELPPTFASLLRLRGLAEGAALATLIEAVDRGVVAASDHPRPAAWVRATAEAAGVPVTASLASSLARASAAADDGDTARLLETACAGRIGAHEAARAVREFRALRPRIPAELWDVATDTLVDHLAAGAGVRELAAAHEAIVATYGDEGEFEERQKAQRRLRSFGDFHRDTSGMFVATLRLDPDSHARLDPVLTAHSAPTPSPDGTADPRDRYTRRADALLEICTHVGTDPTALPESRPGSAARAQILLTVPLSDLARHATGATRAGDDDGGAEQRRGRRFVTTESGHPLAGHVLDRLLCDADLTPVLVADGGSDPGRGDPGRSNAAATGHPLDVGRRFRLATSRQRAALVVRDGGCTFPGCTLPPSWCEAHHIRPWDLLGRTDLDNLTLLCGRHHTVVHAKHYTAAVTSTGVAWHLDLRERWPERWSEPPPSHESHTRSRPWRELRHPITPADGNGTAPPTTVRRRHPMRQ